jgi:predicted transcriptional regulator
MKDEQETTKQEEHSSNYAVKIGKNLAERIDNHIDVLKYLKNKDLKKSQWLLEAISEKINREEHLPPYALPKEKHLNIKLDDQLRERMERIVSALKSVRRAYSKKQWIVEAIAEKLDKEEAEAKQLARKKDQQIVGNP